MLNKELEKQHDIVKRFLLRTKAGGYNSIDSSSIDPSESGLVLSLKRELDNALKRLTEKEEEVLFLKKCQKVTKHMELEVIKFKFILN